MTELVGFREGPTTLLAPAGNKERGPGRREPGAFYNPAMALNRDLSVLALAALVRPSMRVLDGLSATGARAVRWRHEVSGDFAVTANDWNPVAVRLIEENAKRNAVAVEITRRPLGALLGERTFDWVDVDPFGSPAEFLDPACRALSGHAVLALTATDATALAGVYPNVCERRYGATPLRGEIGHEIATRILVGAAVRAAARHDIALAPLVGHADDHYYRVTLGARRGAARADAALATLRYAQLCDTCGDRGLTVEKQDVCPACGRTMRVAGPLWGGALFDPALLAKMREDTRELARRGAAEAALARFAEEADAPALGFHLHEAASRAGVECPTTEAFMAALRERGFRATRTHFGELLVKTDASAADISETLHG
ncbi:MAG: hypothetical protein ACYDCK_11000 [Thermoplasmatota archaeon]